MGFGNNSGLIASANIKSVAANGAADFINGTADEADIFVFAPGTSGDDTLAGFNKNDSIASDRKIFDGNGDGIINLGNEVLDIDRTGSGNKNAGADQIALLRDDQTKITDLRYLGTKEDKFIYADAEVRFSLETDNGASKVKEGTVGDDALLSGTGGNFDFLYDTALGLNLGGDTISDFTKGDRIVTTISLFDGDHDGKITFGKNGVLDLAGEDIRGADKGPGGQIALAGLSHVDVLGDKIVDGVHYYFYGIADA